MKKPKRYILPEKVKNDSLLIAGSKIFYAVLLDMADKIGRIEELIPNLAKQEKVTTTTIHAWLKNLEECGYLKKELIHTGKGMQYNVRIRLTNPEM